MQRLIVDLLWADPRGKTGASVEMWASLMAGNSVGNLWENSSIFQFHRGNINGKIYEETHQFCRDSWLIWI